MDIREKVQEIVDRVKSDKDFASKFSNDPLKAIEAVIGVDLPDDKIKALIIEEVKSKIMPGKADGLLGKVKKLFWQPLSYIHF